LYEATLADQECVLGPDHALTQTVRQNLHARQARSRPDVRKDAFLGTRRQEGVLPDIKGP
jgi:hypothetical protein